MCQFFTLDLKQQERIHWEKRESCLFLFFFTNAWANPSRSLSRSKTLSIEPAGFINWAWFGLIFFTNKLRKWNLKIKKKERGIQLFYLHYTSCCCFSPGEYWRISLTASDSSHLQNAIVWVDQIFQTTDLTAHALLTCFWFTSRKLASCIELTTVLLVEDS